MQIDNLTMTTLTEVNHRRGSFAAPSLSEYMDYRRFLADWYIFRRRSTERDIRPYSYAVFSAAADIKSPNYLKMIIEGKRNLSPDMIGNFSRALGLSKDASEEFRCLVFYTQTADPGERNRFLQQLNDIRVDQKLKSGEINRQTWEKIPNWATWVIYHMLDQAGVDYSPENLRLLLRNKASNDEIIGALKTLLNTGEITQDDVSGVLRRTHNLIESPEDVPVALVRRLQSELMYLGLESLFQDPPTEREFGSLTLSLTQEEFEELKFQLRKMRKQIHKDNAINRQASSGDRVYQLNLQLFPLTNKAPAK